MAAAATDDHILQAPNDMQVSSLVHHAQVAGKEVVRRVERVFGGDRPEYGSTAALF